MRGCDSDTRPCVLVGGFSQGGVFSEAEWNNVVPGTAVHLYGSLVYMSDASVT